MYSVVLIPAQNYGFCWKPELACSIEGYAVISVFTHRETIVQTSSKYTIEAALIGLAAISPNGIFRNTVEMVRRERARNS